jgi:hypothetical protein
MLTLVARQGDAGKSPLREIAPKLKRAVAMFSSGAAPHASFLRAAELVAPSLGVSASIVALFAAGSRPINSLYPLRAQQRRHTMQSNSSE